MNLPAPGSDAPRQYSEAELVRILRVAAELQECAEGELTGDELTMTQIQQIAAEVGIEPRYVAAAAALVATEAGERWTRWLGTTVRGDLTRTVPGVITDAGWKQIVSLIPAALNRKGQHSYVPGALEWVHSDAGSEVRVEVSDANGQTHIQMRTDHREAAVMYLTLGPVLGAAAAVVPIAAFGWTEALQPWLVLGGGAGGGGIAAWAALRSVSARWKRRMRALLQELAGITESAGTGDPNP